VFKSPGNSAPHDWPAERRGGLQHSKGFHALLKATLTLPSVLTASPMLTWLTDEGLMTIAASPVSAYGLTLDIGDAQGALAKRLSLPLTSPIYH
jgi:hypothetical protein